MIVYQNQQDNPVLLTMLGWGWHTLYDVKFLAFTFTLRWKKLVSKTYLHCYQFLASNAFVLAIRTILCEETFEGKKRKKQIA